MNIMLYVNYISILKDTPKSKFMKSVTFFHKYIEDIIYLITLDSICRQGQELPLET